MSHLYRGLWLLTWPFISLFYPRKTYGKENRPGEGAYLICGNHSSNSDPFFMAYSMGVKHHIHFMAKMEILKIPVLASILRGIAIIPVDRKSGGAMAMKQAMKLLKAGGKVGLFPEGTRVRGEEESAARAGAVRMAARMGVPILPVYIETNKRPFRFNRVVIGKAYHLNLDKTAKGEDYDKAAQEMMQTIKALGEQIS